MGPWIFSSGGSPCISIFIKSLSSSISERIRRKKCKFNTCTSPKKISRSDTRALVRDAPAFWFQPGGNLCTHTITENFKYQKLIINFDAEKPMVMKGQIINSAVCIYNDCYNISICRLLLFHATARISVIIVVE